MPVSVIPVITLDGASGSGKGTIARRLSEHLGWHLLDSGALYRCLAWVAVREAIDLDDVDQLASWAARDVVEFVADGETTAVRCLGEVVTEAIRTEEVGRAASRIALIPLVREALLARQHAFRRAPGLVADGRDMGTVVFPDAQLKIFLMADVSERVRRRQLQLKAQGIHVSLSALSEELCARDARDAGRAVSPLVAAEDAIRVDTSGRSVQAVFEGILAEARRVGVMP